MPIKSRVWQAGWSAGYNAVTNGQTSRALADQAAVYCDGDYDKGADYIKGYAEGRADWAKDTASEPVPRSEA